MGVIFEMYNRHFIEGLKERFPAGTRIELKEMEDPYDPVPPGTRGTVLLVDDVGQLQMKWDNGRTLALIPGRDSFRKLTQQELAEEQQRADETDDFSDVPFQRPQAALIGADGNIFNLLGIAQKALRKCGQREKAAEMSEKVFKSKSYDQALGILMEYVEPVSEDEIKEETEDEDFGPQM